MNIQFSNLEFNWKDLNGKTLELVVKTDTDSLAKEMVTVVMGYCKEDGNTYVIHTETKRI